MAVPPLHISPLPLSVGYNNVSEDVSLGKGVEGGLKCKAAGPSEQYKASEELPNLLPITQQI